MSAQPQKAPLGPTAGKMAADASLRPKGAAVPPRFPQPDYERLRRLAALYERSAPSRSPLASIARMPFILALGVLFGMGAAWWGMSSGANPFAKVFEKSISIFSPALPGPSESGFAKTANGIALGELPYDGVASHSSERKEPDSPLKMSPDELPYGESSGASDILSSTIEGLQQELREESASFPTVSPGAALNTKPEPAVVSDKRNDQSVAQAATNEKKAMKSAHKRRAGQRFAKDKEIERIRQQAAEELKKKTENRRAIEGVHARSRTSTKRLSAQAGASSAAVKSHRTRGQFEKCKQSGSLTQREQCKWRACAGKWGKNGCPSYAQQAASS